MTPGSVGGANISPGTIVGDHGSEGATSLDAGACESAVGVGNSSDVEFASANRSATDGYGDHSSDGYSAYSCRPANSAANDVNNRSATIAWHFALWIAVGIVLRKPRPGLVAAIWNYLERTA
jgi:hypothetical protein